MRPLRAGLSGRLQRGIAWNFVAVVCTQGSTLVINVIVANFLGRQVFGEFAMIRSTLLALAAIGQLATGYTATRYVAEFRSTNRERAGRTLGLCSILSTSAACGIALVLFAGAPWLAADVLRAPHLAAGFMVVAVAVFFTVMNGYQIGALAGLEAYRLLAIAGAINATLSVAVCALAAWGGGLYGTLVGISCSAFLQWVTLCHLLRAEIARQQIVVCYRGLRQELPVLAKFALPAALSSFVSLPALWLASMFLVRETGGYEQMALYSAANSFRALVLFLPYIANNVSMSLLNNQRGLRDQAGYRRVFWTNFRLSATVVIIGAIAVALFGRWLLMGFGRSFSDGYAVLVLLMLPTISEGVAAAIHQVLLSQEKLWQSLLAVSIPRDSAIAIGSYLLVPSRGAAGLALAYTAGWIFALLMTIVLARSAGLELRSTRRPHLLLTSG